MQFKKFRTKIQRIKSTYIFAGSTSTSARRRWCSNLSIGALAVLLFLMRVKCRIRQIGLIAVAAHIVASFNIIFASSFASMHIITVGIAIFDHIVRILLLELQINGVGSEQLLALLSLLPILIVASWLLIERLAVRKLLVKVHLLVLVFLHRFLLLIHF